MARDPRLYLEDIRKAGTLIVEFTSGHTLATFSGNAMLRSAVERQFEIIGEAINQLSRIDASLASQIPDARRIVDFRNVLAHGYAVVDDVLVWQAARINLPPLLQKVKALLAS